MQIKREVFHKFQFQLCPISYIYSFKCKQNKSVSGQFDSIHFDWSQHQKGQSVNALPINIKNNMLLWANSFWSIVKKKNMNEPGGNEACIIWSNIFKLLSYETGVKQINCLIFCLLILFSLVLTPVLYYSCAISHHQPATNYGHRLLGWGYGAQLALA